MSCDSLTKKSDEVVLWFLQNFNESNTDGWITVADSNLF